MLTEDSRKPGCCCGGAPPARPEPPGSRADRPVAPLQAEPRLTAPGITGWLSTPVGDVPQISTRLQTADRLGAWKVRWGIGRMRYRIEPGLYAVGTPSADSPALVSANYKLSFDRLRSRLGGLSAWVLVLETQGVNVWCAAGKGTFGTDELVRRIEASRLPEVVSHRTVVLPQLGAPGVAAHEVRRQSGFRVVYGPVRAEDLPAFLAAGMKAAAPEMRRVRFPVRDRLVLIPVELAFGAKYLLWVAAGFLVLAGLGPDGYAAARVASVGLGSAALLLAASVGSVVLTAALLPWLPGRAFAVKGTWLGLGMLLALLGYEWLCGALFAGWLTRAAWCLLLPAVASFTALNFTGASTYTSLSGVKRETRIALPLQALGAVAGIVLWLIGRFA